MRNSVVSFLVFVCLVLGQGNGMVLGQEPAKACDEPESTQFDFWLGEWAVHAKDKEVGRNRISKIHGGCTVLEEYTTAPGGFEGKSFNYFDATDGKWHQVWVDNGGTRLHLQGGFSDGVMIMSGTRNVGGKELADRISWYDNPEGTVRQVWDQSYDQGKTWTTIFDGLYRPMH